MTSGKSNFSDIPAHLHIIFQRMVVENWGNCSKVAFLAICEIFYSPRGGIAQW